MESEEEKIAQMKLAIQKLMLDNQNKQLIAAQDNEDDQLLLSRLLSKLDAVKRGGLLDQADSITVEAMTPVIGNMEGEEENIIKADSGNNCEAEEIVKEIRKVKRQNLITHCLLSVMIILTVAWQLSEVSLLLRLKDGVNHPFRSIGSMLKGMIKKPVINGLDVEKDPSTHSDNDNSSLSSLKMPELPHVEIPEFSLNGDKQ